jgi:transposase
MPCGLLAEHGIVTGKGPGGVNALLRTLHDAQDHLPAHASSALHSIGSQLRFLTGEIDRLDADEGAPLWSARPP